MKSAPRLNLLVLCCSLLMIFHIRFRVFADSITTADQKMLTNQQQQQQQQQLQFHQSMSCYVCSTMDYENPADNYCRNMRQNRLNSQSSQLASMISYAPTTTTTTSTAATITTTTHLNQNDPTSTMASSIEHNYPSHGSQANSQDFYQSTNNMSQGQQNYNSQSVDNQQYGNSSLISSTTQNPQQQQQSLVPVQSSYQLPQTSLRSMSPPTNHIRQRACLEDENFCSVVSVVRIEFVNENWVSRFWAMERNCSKSCNTGCMLIGERLRLRVCSQCCRTPNCNIGNGASPKTSWKGGISLNTDTMLLLALMLILPVAIV